MIKQFSMPKALALCALLSPAIAMAQKGAFTITVDYGPGITNKAILNRYTLTTGSIKDTALIINGQATFKGIVNAERQIGQIIMMEGNKTKSAIFYLEPGKIRISYPAKGNYTIGGTPLNKDYNDFKVMVNNMVDSANKSNAGITSTEFDPNLMDARFNLIRKFITTHPKSVISVDLLNQIGTHYKNQALMLAEYDKLTTAAKTSPQGQELQARIKGMGAAEVGKMAPAFTLKDIAGNTVSLASLKGKYVLIDFWATWCGPCMMEMPNLRKAYASYKDKGFEIVGVSLDTPGSETSWRKVIKSENLSWLQVSDLKGWNSAPALLYNINSVPASFLLDPQGNIIATKLRGEELQKKLAEVL